jgi:hypothetical protein
MSARGEDLFTLNSPRSVSRRLQTWFAMVPYPAILYWTRERAWPQRAPHERRASAPSRKTQERASPRRGKRGRGPRHLRQWQVLFGTLPPTKRRHRWAGGGGNATRLSAPPMRTHARTLTRGRSPRMAPARPLPAHPPLHPPCHRPCAIATSRCAGRWTSK